MLVIVLLLVLERFDYEHDYESRARFLWLRPPCRGGTLSVHFVHIRDDFSGPNPLVTERTEANPEDTESKRTGPLLCGLGVLLCDLCVTKPSLWLRRSRSRQISIRIVHVCDDFDGVASSE